MPSGDQWWFDPQSTRRRRTGRNGQPPASAHLVIAEREDDTALQHLRLPGVDPQAFQKWAEASGRLSRESRNGPGPLTHVFGLSHGVLPPTMYGGCDLHLDLAVWNTWLAVSRERLLLTSDRSDNVAAAAMALQVIASSFPYINDKDGGDFGLPIHLLEEGDCEDFALFIAGVARGLQAQQAATAAEWECCAVLCRLLADGGYHVMAALRSLQTDKLYLVDATAGVYPKPLPSNQQRQALPAAQLRRYKFDFRPLSPRGKGCELGHGITYYTQVIGLGTPTLAPAWYDLQQLRSRPGVWHTMLQPSTVRRQTYGPAEQQLIGEGRKYWEALVPRAMQTLAAPELADASLPRANGWLVYKDRVLADGNRLFKATPRATFGPHLVYLHAYQPRSIATTGSRPYPPTMSPSPSNSDDSSDVTTVQPPGLLGSIEHFASRVGHDISHEWKSLTGQVESGVDKAEKAATQKLKQASKALRSRITLAGTETALEDAAMLAVAARPNNDKKKSRKPRQPPPPKGQTSHNIPELPPSASESRRRGGSSNRSRKGRTAAGFLPPNGK